MRKLTIGKIKLIVSGESEPIPDLLGLPEGSAITFSGEQDSETETYLRKLSKKYRIKDAIEEDVRLKAVMYRGGEVAVYDNTVYCIGGVDPLAYVTELGLYATHGAEALIIENAAVSLPGFAVSAYGALAAKLTDVTDYRISRLLAEKRYDASGARNLRKEIAGFVKKGVGAPITGIALKAASIDGFADNESSETQMSRALSAIIENEAKRSLPEGMIKLISAFVLSGVYKRFILGNFGFVMPPDNNLRLECASDYFGIPELRLAAMRAADLSEDVLKKAMYSIKNSKIELLAEICFNEIVLAEALRRIKKAMPGCGYREFSSLDTGDLRMALALAPEMSKSGAYGMYPVMKSMGVLDGLLQ